MIQKDKSATLATNNDQYLFQPVPNIVLDDQGGQQISVRTDGKCPTLRAEAHGNQPIVCSLVRSQCFDARDNGDGETVPALTGDHQNRVTAHTAVVCEPTPIHDQATRFAGKRDERHDGKGNGLGVGNPGDPMNTLTAGDRHAVAFRLGGFAKYIEGEIGTLRASDGDSGLGSENLICEKSSYSIVRRLTPTECARLQGFPDFWAHPDQKTELTDEEYQFWLNVRNTHAAINGKAVKQYTREQMLRWYNGLHTDSAEYKLWGNGIALPCALYVMEGIAEELEKEETN